MASRHRNSILNLNSNLNPNPNQVENGGMEYLSSSSNAMGVWHTLEAMVGQNMRRNLNYEGYNNVTSPSQFNHFTAIRRNDSLNEHFQSTPAGRKSSSAEMANSDCGSTGKDVVSEIAKVSGNGATPKKHVSIQVKKKKAKGGKKVLRDKYEDLGVDCR